MMSCTMTLQELVQKGQASLDNINQLLKSKSLQVNCLKYLQVFTLSRSISPDHFVIQLPP